MVKSWKEKLIEEPCSDYIASYMDVHSMWRFRDITDFDVAFFHFSPPSLRRIDAPSSKLFPSNPRDFPANHCLSYYSDPGQESPRAALEPGLIQNKCDAPVAFRGYMSRFHDTRPVALT